jgi:hypothetical protein
LKESKREKAAKSRPECEVAREQPSRRVFHQKFRRVCTLHVLLSRSSVLVKSHSVLGLVEHALRAAAVDVLVLAAGSLIGKRLAGGLVGVWF